MDESATCIFCKMMRGEISCRKLYEDEATLSILDIGQMVSNNGEFIPGRSLVIPRRHVTWFYDLEDEEARRLFIVAKIVAGKVKQALNPEFVTMFVRGQRVPHAHIIVQPSGTNDSLDDMFKVLRSPATIAPEALLDEMARRVREI